MDKDKLARMANTVRTGGKGSVRRKKKAVHKATTTDDKRLQSTLKRLGVNTIPQIEEVNLFQSDGNVIHFNSPKVQASISANTYVVSGPSQTQSIKELLPGIMSQIGTDASQLQRLAETIIGHSQFSGNALPLKELGFEYIAIIQTLRSNPALQKGKTEEEDDDDVPDLVENFEEASK